MNSNSTTRIVLIFASIVLALYLLFPTIQLSLMSKEEKEALKVSNPDELIKKKEEAIALGLDLQGGMHVVLEVDVNNLLKELARNKNSEFLEALKATQAIVEEVDTDFVDELKDQLEQREMTLSRYYGNADRRTEEAVITFLKEQMTEAVDRSLEILRNRIDQFGVTEPTIQKQGGRRIILELAGVTDPSRVREIIGKTALLEFQLLKDAQIVNAFANKLNQFILGKITNDTTLATAGEDSVKSESSATSLDEMFAETATDSAQNAGGADLLFEEGIFSLSPFDNGSLIVPADKEHKFKKIIAMPAVKKMVAEVAGNAEILFGSNKVGEAENQFYQVFIVNKKVDLTGSTIEETTPQAGNPNDPSNIGKYEVALTLNNSGAKTFSRVTGANTQKRLAIVLDEKVYMAPTIQNKISNGRAVITHIESFDEARDLSIILKAGALPAPVEIMEERTVGASLGEDSIVAGSWSALIGIVIVMIFMVIYYRLAGFVANIALILNIMFIMGVMASLGATLTLPGIAGIILTIGMAVDANVLIFERIREELKKGKTVRNALDVGYSKAVVTILDANITTLIAGLVLYTYGSGPIKGFAVTLIIGIAASMYTAIIITRVIFNAYLNKSAVKQLSI